MLVAVAGCVAQAEGAEIQRRAPFVDIVFGPQAYHRLPELVARAARTEEGGVLDTSFPAEPKFDYLPETSAAPSVSAFLTIQEGCDKFCTFCVVPYTRGSEYSRPSAEITQAMVGGSVCGISHSRGSTAIPPPAGSAAITGSAGNCSGWAFPEAANSPSDSQHCKEHRRSRLSVQK